MTKGNINQGLIKELLDKLYKMKKDYQKAKIKCGIIGQSGSGKSSLANSIVGEKFADVGVVETTGEPQESPHKGKGVIFVDLPGCGTKKWPRKTYVNKLKLSTYDCFILVTAERFFENDIYLYKKITSSLHKPCFVVRNKFDLAVEDGKHDNNLTEKEVYKSIEAYIRKNLLPIKLNMSYLISARYPIKYDFPLLVTDISNSLSGIKRKRFIADMAVLNKKAFIEKREIAEHLVGIYSGLAAGNALNPIPGLDISVDVGLLLKLSREIVHIYGLTEEQFEYSIKLVKKANIQALRQRSFQITTRYFTKEAILLLLKRFGPKVGLKYTAKWVPFVGQALAALLGYKLTYHFGETLIDDCESAAKKIVDSIMK